MPQKELSEKLGKKEAEISKWLSGSHNFTLRTISKLEAALSIKIINPDIYQEVKKTVISNPENFFNQEYLHSLIDESWPLAPTESTKPILTKKTNSTETVST